VWCGLIMSYVWWVGWLYELLWMSVLRG